MSSGLAVVCSDVGDCAEMLADMAEISMFPRGDTEAFAALLGRLQEAPELRRRIGNVLRTRAETHYELSSMIEKYRDLYRAVATRGGGVR